MVSVTKLDHPLEWINELPKSLSMKNFLLKENENKKVKTLKINIL